MATFCNGEDNEMIAALNLCYMKRVYLESEQDIKILEEIKRRSLCQFRVYQNSETEQRAEKIKQERGIVNVAQGYPQHPRPQLQTGLFYGDYAPPRIPPVPGSLRQLIGVCSKPFEKQLTSSDVRDDQSRLAMNKEDVETHLRPLLNEYEDLNQGIHVTTYDLDGKEFPMMFKTWVSKIHILTGGWKAFCHAHDLVEKQDFVTVWMFRNIATRRLCFVINCRRMPVFETIKKRRTRKS